MARIGIYFAISPFFCRFDGSTLGIFTMDLRIERKEFACQDSFNLPRGGFHVVTFDHSSKVSNRFRWWEIFSWREKKREKVFRIQDASISVYLYFSFHWKKVGKERKGEHFSKWNRALSFRKILSLIEISLWSLKHEICNCDIKLKMMSTDFFFKKRMTIADRICKKIFVYLYFQWNSNFSKQKSRCEIRMWNWRWIWFSLDY